MKVGASVAIVTGGAGGIGSAIAARLVEAGASVVVTDTDGVAVARVADELARWAPGRVLGLAGDCSVEADIVAAVRLATDVFGPVDLYVANAGVGVGQGLQASDDDWMLANEVNVMAHVRAARVLVPQWLERGHGYFLSTASAAGLLTQLGSPTYSVTKHGAVAFAEWLAVTYGWRGVAVSCLCPMGVNTAMLAAGSSADDEHANLAARAVSEAGRVMEPLDVADIVLQAIQDERFLVLPHPEVREFAQRKGADPDRWIRGMQRYQQSIG